MPIYFIYLIYTAVLAVFLISTVPKKDIKFLFFLGVIYGAIIDVIIVFVVDTMKIANYLNYGPFGFMGIPFFPPLAWTIYYMLFLYFQPKHKPWNYIFGLASASYNTLFSNVLQNLGIFKWHYSRLIIPLIIYIMWNFFVTFTYQKYFLKK